MLRSDCYLKRTDEPLEVLKVLPPPPARYRAVCAEQAVQPRSVHFIKPFHGQSRQSCLLVTYLNHGMMCVFSLAYVCTYLTTISIRCWNLDKVASRLWAIDTETRMSVTYAAYRCIRLIH
jgi:hypothetical protein